MIHDFPLLCVLPTQCRHALPILDLARLELQVFDTIASYVSPLVTFKGVDEMYNLISVDSKTSLWDAEMWLRPRADLARCLTNMIFRLLPTTPYISTQLDDAPNIPTWFVVRQAFKLQASA